MTLDQRCKECFERNFERLLIRFPLSVSRKSEFTSFLKNLLDHSELGSNPEYQRELQRKLRDLNGTDDPYKEEKIISNQVALELYQEWKPKVLAADDPFCLALRLALAGNVMDYGAGNQFDIKETISKVLQANFSIDDSSLLRQRIREANRILYLGDNAGEIVFDKLLIETIMHPYVTYAVRGGPAINDATLEDSESTGMDLVADVISNGYDAPTTIVRKSSLEFQSHYESADLIISKGQGNYEGLMNEKDPRIFFLLMAKCDLIAENIGVPKGSFVVSNYGNN
jgi:damage-control phosphatase, subfamily I